MTNPQLNYLTKVIAEMRNGFFDQPNHGLDYIYDMLYELPSLLRSYQDQLGDEDYNNLKDELKKYKKALQAVRDLNSITHVFS